MKNPHDVLGQAGFDTHTHSLTHSLTHIIGYLHKGLPEMPEIILIGIQPGPFTFHNEVSAPVICGGEEVAEMLCNRKEAQIPKYIPEKAR